MVSSAGMRLSSLRDQYLGYLRRTWPLWALLFVAAWCWVAYLAVSTRIGGDGYVYVLS